MALANALKKVPSPSVKQKVADPFISKLPDTLMPIEPFIGTFYAMYELDLIHKDHGINIGMGRYQQWFNSRLANVLFDYCALACLGEARHAYELAEKWCKNLPPGESRHSIYRTYGLIDPIRTGQTLFDIFDSSWGKDGFGGKKWAEIADAYRKYGSVSDTVFIDRIINKQHNGGCLFNKPIFLTYSFGSGEYLKHLLDYRRYGSILNNKKNFSFKYGDYYLPILVTDRCLDFINETKKLISLEGSVARWPTGENYHGYIFRELSFPKPLKWGYIELKVEEESSPKYKDKKDNKAMLKYLQDNYDYDGCTCIDCVSTEYKEKKELEKYTPLGDKTTKAEPLISKLEYLKKHYSYFGCECADCVNYQYDKALTTNGLKKDEANESIFNDNDIETEEYLEEEEVFKNEYEEQESYDTKPSSPVESDIGYKIIDTDGEEPEPIIEFIDGEWK